MSKLSTVYKALIVKEVLKEFIISATDAEVDLTLNNFAQWSESIYADYDDDFNSSGHTEPQETCSIC
jgi:hypothetical protein